MRRVLVSLICFRDYLWEFFLFPASSLCRKMSRNSSSGSNQCHRNLSMSKLLWLPLRRQLRCSRRITDRNGTLPLWRPPKSLTGLIWAQTQCLRLAARILLGKLSGLLSGLPFCCHSFCHSFDEGDLASACRQILGFVF